MRTFACAMALAVTWGVQGATSDSVAEKGSTSPRKELAQVRAKLAPVRTQAEGAPKVKAAREAVQTALTNYYAVLRATMVELDPSTKPLIERERELRMKVKGSAGR